MPSNLGIEWAPFLVLGNFIRNLRLQKGKKGPLGGLVEHSETQDNIYGSFRKLGVPSLGVYSLGYHIRVPYFRKLTSNIRKKTPPPISPLRRSLHFHDTDSSLLLLDPDSSKLTQKLQPAHGLGFNIGAFPFRIGFWLQEGPPPKIV